MSGSAGQSEEGASNDTIFRRAMVFFTIVFLAVAYGWLACLNRTANGDINFHWRWSALLWIAIGIVSPIYFWRQVWPVKNSGQNRRKRVVFGSFVLVAPWLWWMVYPLWFLSGKHFADVLTGLLAAAAVLSFGAWMVFKLIKGFAEEDAAQARADSNHAENSRPDDSAK
ncbi:MAG TPA: hypothetical protein VHG89_11805 [Verrucomicrobiae bacterium]|nr:hypothetical protein [Verrucomicrobiae bacterium]